MSKPGSAEVILKPASAARYDSLEIPGLLKHGRVSLMRELFQCGKPLPIEDLCGEDEANQNVSLTPVRAPSSSINSRAPFFMADLKGESAVQKRLQNAIKESTGDADDEDVPSMKDLAASLVKQLNSSSTDTRSSNGIDKIKPVNSRSISPTAPPIPARPTKCPPLRRFSSASAQEEEKVQTTNGPVTPTEQEMKKSSAAAEVLEANTASQDLSMEIAITTPTVEPEAKNSTDVGTVEAAVEEEGEASDEYVECSDEVEHEEDEESSAEDTADWEPIDINADSSKISKFALPSHLHPVAVNDAGVYLLDDGHFFYQTDGVKPLPDSPKPSTSTEEEEQESVPNKEGSPSPSKKRRSVTFSTEPITVFSTHSVTAYQRRNDTIDPLVASAEYELEKRLEDLDLFEMDLNKGTNGLGISILGMGMTFVNGVEKLGIFVKAITPGGAADIDGRMRVYDQLIEVDGQNLVGVSQSFAATVLRNTSGSVHFVVGREKPDTQNSIVALLEADGQMTSSTCSSAGAGSDVIDDNQDAVSHSLKFTNSDSGATIRKLLEDASLAAAKANFSDDEDEDAEIDGDNDECEDEDNDMDVDDGLSTSDEPYLNTPTSTNVTETEETEEEEHTLRQNIETTDGNTTNVNNNNATSSSSFDAGLASSSSLSLGDSSASHHARYNHPSQVILLALQRLEDGEEKGVAEDDLGMGLLSENEREKLRSAIPKAAVPLVRCLALDLFASEAQIKRLRSRVRRLGQRLTDQEAAADEAIERLCLRCHNLETRLADAQSAASAALLDPDAGSGGDVSPTHTPTPSENGGRGRLSPVLEQGEDTEETECEEPTTGTVVELKSENTNLGDLQAKYSSLVELYEAALKREEDLKKDLEALQKNQMKKSSVDVDCQTDRVMEFEFDSTADEIAVSSDDRRAINSSSTVAPTPRPRSANHLPVHRDVGVVSGRSGSLDAVILDVNAPPPRPPKPLMTVASVTTNVVSPPPLSGRLNLAALPDSERILLDSRDDPFASTSGANQFYECHMQRIRVGTAGAFAKKRPPSRYASAHFTTFPDFGFCGQKMRIHTFQRLVIRIAVGVSKGSTVSLRIRKSPILVISGNHNIRMPLTDELPTPNIGYLDIAAFMRVANNPDFSASLTSSLFPASSVVTTQSNFKPEPSPPCGSLRNNFTPHPRTPFAVPLGDLREALAGLKPVGERKLIGNSRSINNNIQTLPVSINSAFYPPGPHPLVDSFHDSHSSLLSHHRTMSQPSHPSTTENVRSPDWTESTSPEARAHTSQAPSYLYHHYPRYSPASSHTPPRASPAKSGLALENTNTTGGGRPAPPNQANEIPGPLLAPSQSPSMRNPLHPYHYIRYLELRRWLMRPFPTGRSRIPPPWLHVTGKPVPVTATRPGTMTHCPTESIVSRASPAIYFLAAFVNHHPRSINISLLTLFSSLLTPPHQASFCTLFHRTRTVVATSA
ncbi:hypothetical protein Aperf_G00000062403 [Anoplocephala perfoliata]